MHEKFRHFIEDFQMKVCPAPPSLEFLDFGCPGRTAPGHVCVLAVSLPVPWHAAHTPLQMGWQGAVLGARGRHRVGREAVSPSPFTNSCGDGQKFLREIQRAACSLSHCSSLALSITGARQPHGGCWAALSALRHPCSCWGCLEPPNSLRAHECQGTVICSLNPAAGSSPWHEMLCGNSFSKWCPEIFNVIQGSLLYG